MDIRKVVRKKYAEAALEKKQYRSYLGDAGFENIEIEPARVFRIEKGCCGGAEVEVDTDSARANVDGTFMSACIKATRPADV
jgi:hypothetical protein